MSTPPSDDQAASCNRLPEDIGSLDIPTLAQLVQADQQHRWAAGEKVLVEEYLQRYPRLGENSEVKVALLFHELRLRRQAGEQPQLDELAARFPALARALARLVYLQQSLAEAPPPRENRSGGAVAGATVRSGNLPPDATGPDIPTRSVPEPRPPLEGDAAEHDGTRLVQVPGYVILEKLGEGGMGVVYKAKHIALRRIVALKMIRQAEYAGADERRRFQAEAEAVAKLQHHNIIQVYEVGEHNGMPYFSLEYCSGGSLEKQLDGTPWEAHRAAALVQTLAGTMHVAHQAHIVHRDLKPGNVLLTADGAPKITDFGLVKRLDMPGHTQSGAVVGTPSYMAPEQAGGRDKVGPPADVYALGAILYELLTGRPPFRAATPMDTVLQLLSEEPVAVRRSQPKVPKDIETICHKCLEKEPSKRYASAENLAEDLRRFLGGEPVQARPVGPVGRLAKWARRRPAVAALMALVAVVTVAGGTGILWALGEVVQQRNVARDEAVRADGEAERAGQETTKAQKAATVAEEKAEEARQAARRADEKTEEAKKEADAAKKARDRAELQTYYAEIGRADARLSAGEGGGAKEVLERISLGQRGWEHRYLQHRTDGTPLTLRGHTAAVGSAVYSPDGTRIASASLDKTVKVWDTNSGTEVLTLRGHTDGVSSVVYSPDGGCTATASVDNTVKVWGARSGTAVLTLRGHTASVSSVVYSPDGSRIATASDDGTVKVWDARSGKLLEGNKAGPWFPGSNLSPNGQQGAVPDQRLYHAKEVEDIRNKLPKPDAWEEGVLLFQLLHELDANKPGWKEVLRIEGGKGYWLNRIAFTPDGRAVAAGGAVILFDLDEGKEVHRVLEVSGARPGLALSRDGKRFLTGHTADNTLRLAEVDTGKELQTFKGHTAGVFGVALSADGTVAASCSSDGTLRLWDVKASKELRRLQGFRDRVRCVAFSADGRSRLSGHAGDGSDFAVRLWDVATGKERLVFRGHEKEVTAVTWLPDGRSFLSSSMDGTVRHWDAAAGKELCRMTHSGGVSDVAVSPDGKLAASAGLEDKTVCLWDLLTGGERWHCVGHSGGVLGVAFSQDGRQLLSCDTDGTVYLWRDMP